MLKTLIKRDGSEEPNMPHKLNGWAIWAQESLGDRVDWSGPAMAAQKAMPEKATTRELMVELINQFLAKENWAAYMVAGRLYANLVRKDIFGSDQLPTLRSQHLHMQSIGYMKVMDYSLEDYGILETYIHHELDYKAPEFALKQMLEKYSLRNYVTDEAYETPQFTYMRMAMAIAEKEGTGQQRLDNVRAYYDLLSGRKLSAPTPNYLYFGTPSSGWASCCIYAASDSIPSLAVGDHIAYMMTANAAGLGSHISTRNINDPIRGGRISHKGVYKYYKNAASNTTTNMQSARGGAGTSTFMCFHPQAEEILQYQNPLTPDSRANRDLHFSMSTNQLFREYACENKDIFTFTEFSAPDLYNAFFSPDIERFYRLYEQYENDPDFKKNYVSARRLVMLSFGEAFTSGTAYLTFADEMNTHTPFIINDEHRILAANLCQEICEIQIPYQRMEDLYSSEDHGRGEIAMCNLAAIPVDNVSTTDDEEYFNACYRALKMIDYSILNGKYPFPHLEFTVKQRMNAAVGMMGVATVMAREGLRYDTVEGKKRLHQLAERHMYWLIKASIAISKERGLAPWIHKTKWPQGWTPKATYNRGVDDIADFVDLYDWTELSQEIIDNGGLAHSTLAGHMPGESSSKALASTNSMYPVRAPVLTKKDGNNNILRWAAVDGDLLGDKYQPAFEVPVRDMIDCYGIVQKWTDQAISADIFRRFQPGEVKVTEEEVMETFNHMADRGMKTRYYTATQRPKERNINETTTLVASKAPIVANVPVVSAIDRIAAQIRESMALQGAGSDYFEMDNAQICTGGGCSL